MSIWNVDQLELDIPCAVISYADASMILHTEYSGYDDYGYRFANAATSVHDTWYITRVPLAGIADELCLVKVDEAGYFIYQPYRVKISVGHDYDVTISVKTADYYDSTSRINVIGDAVKDANFRMKSDYWVAETDYRITVQDEFYYKESNTRLIAADEFSRVDARFRLDTHFSANRDHGFRYRQTGNIRYVTRIRFKERERYGSISWRLEYMAPYDQVWNPFTVVNAKVNGEKVAVWSPILQNPCYANIYRNGEWIDIYVRPVWTTEVRMVIYSTEDPFNRTGIEEFAIYADMPRTFVNELKVGWFTESDADLIQDQTCLDYMKVGFEPFYEMEAEYEVLNDFKLFFRACTDETSANNVNDIKIFWYPKYLFADAGIMICQDEPYKNVNFYSKQLIVELYDATTFIDLRGLMYRDATTSLSIPDFYDVEYAIGSMGTICEDATTAMYHDQPWIDAVSYVFNDKPYVDINFYMDTIFVFIDDYTIKLFTADPYKDHNFTLCQAIDWADATVSSHIADIVFSENAIASYVIGQEIQWSASASYVVNSGTVSNIVSGSYNLLRGSQSHHITCKVMGDKEIAEIDALKMTTQPRRNEVFE
jgi:hypothetical protein